MTSIGCGDSKGALSEETYAVLQDALEAKTKVEQQLFKFYKFTTDFTIIRPGGLLTAPATGSAVLTVGRAHGDWPRRCPWALRSALPVAVGAAHSTHAALRCRSNTLCR